LLHSLRKRQRAHSAGVGRLCCSSTLATGCGWVSARHWAAASPLRKGPSLAQVIFDNLNTHKKNDAWLKRHPKVTFHYTPTRTSWLNQIEGWFSIPQGQSLALHSAPSNN
jgi:hypothetical protein